MSLWEIEPEKAEKIARSRDAFEAKKYPLFASAGLLEANDGAKIVEGRRLQQIVWDRMQARFVRKSRLMRFLAAKHCTVEQLARLDKRREACPDDPVYACEFWRSRLRERLAGEQWLDYQIIHKPTGDRPERLKTPPNGPE